MVTIETDLTSAHAYKIQLQLRTRSWCAMVSPLVSATWLSQQLRNGLRNIRVLDGEQAAHLTTWRNESNPTINQSINQSIIISS